MVRVSLREFLATGRFGPVQIGSSRDAIARLLGPPDDRDARARTDETARIWKYGDIELHFEGRGADASLWVIHADNFVSAPHGGPNIDLDPWIVSRALSVDVAEVELTKAGIAYATGQYDWDSDLDEVRTSADVSLVFSGERGPALRKRLLIAISLARHLR
jgi:hypothetical protein